MTPAWPPAHLAEFAKAIPWEYRERKLPWDTACARWSMEAAIAPQSQDAGSLALLLSAGGDCEPWLRTLASWALQTHRTAGWHVTGSRDEPWATEREQAGLPAPLSCVAEVGADGWRGGNAGWALNAVAGDLLHPSLARLVAIAAARGFDAFAWDWCDYDERTKAFEVLHRHRAPFRDLVAELDADDRGRAFAAPLGAWSGFSGGSPWTVRMRVPVASGAGSGLHPEPLSLHAAHAVQSAPRDASMALRLAQLHWDAAFAASAEGRPMPAEAARSVSVVIMFRDHPESTVGAIESVAMQRLRGELELVLLDNGSRPASRAVVERCLSTLDHRIRITRLEVPGAFNHSSQAAIAAEAAQGEVLLWLNNDARFLTDDAIDAMSRWARLDKVASVGVAVVDEAGGVVGGGMQARRLPGAEFNSPVEEASGPLADRPRQTIGNTFACAAVSASSWHALGGMDDVAFPAGYNDVDFCLRAVAAGFRHVNLAHVPVMHARGASRGRQDEIAQKLDLRQRHPWTLAYALGERSIEALNRPHPPLPLLRSERA